MVWLRSIIALWLALASLSGMAADLAAVPPMRGFVVDTAGMLKPSQAQMLEQRLQEFDRSHGSQIAVLIVPTTQPETIEQYSIRVFDAWKVGRKQIDDGVLIVVAAKDRKLRIDVGYGLEGAIPDAIAKRIVMETMSPKFKAGEPYSALVAAIDQIGKLIEGEKLPPPTRSSTQTQAKDEGGQFENLLVIGLIAASVVGGILSMLLGRFLGGMATGGLVGTIAWFMTTSLIVTGIASFVVFLFVLLSGGRGGSSGGGWGSGSSGGGDWGGFSGGGGGMAGGGGASGDW